MAAGGGGKEQQELLALMHQQLLRSGYRRAAKELLEESGQKTFPSSPVPLQEIFAQWKKLQPQKRKADDGKTEIPAKVRVSDPRSSSESSEEEVTNTTKTNVPVNNSSVVNALSSSEDEDSSSEEEAVGEKRVKALVTGNKPTDLLQLAAQKTNSFPGKGVAVASVQAKGRQNKASLNKPLSPTVAKAGQNKVTSGKQVPASQSPGIQGQNTTQVATTKMTVASESSSNSSSSSSESEEEKKLTVVKTPPPPKPALKKAASSSEDSSDDSDSEAEGGGAAAAAKAATVQLKPGVQSAQVKATLAKSQPVSAVPSKGSAVKVSPAKTPANQIRTEAKSTKPTEISETSDSLDSEDEEPGSPAQIKSPRKTPQAVTAVVKSAASSTPSKKTVPVSSPLKQAPKPSVTKLPTPSKKAESSESSESSSESEDDTRPVPVSQKRLQTPQHPARVKQTKAEKPGNLVKAASSTLKGKEAESESSSSSDSENETVPTALKSLPPSATKANAPAQPASATKTQPLSEPLQKAQQSEDSSQDSSDDSDSEEDTVYTQKPSQVTQKPVSIPVKAMTAKNAGVTLGTAGSVQSAGKGTGSPAKSAAASFQKASESSETDSSDATDSEAAAKPTKQVKGNAATPSAKGLQVSSGTSESISSKYQSPVTATTRKVEQNSSKKAKPSRDQALPSKPAGLLKGKENSESSGSSDSEEEEEKEAVTAKQTPKPGIALKAGVTKEAESSSEESSEEDQEPSQSLLASSSGPFKTPASTVLKSTSSMPSKQSFGKAGNLTSSALTKAPGKSDVTDSSSSDSSDSDTDAEAAVVRKAEISSLPASGKEAVMAKGAAGKRAAAGKKEPRRDISKASAAKKTAAKTQSNGKAKGTPAVKLPVAALPKVPSVEVGSKSNEGAVAQVPSTGGQDNTGGATSIVAVKPPKVTKTSKSGEKKPSKKRKLATGEAILGEPKEKKLKGETVLELLTKKKKKKKSKSSDETKPPKNKDGKEKKSDKKKKKTKKLESLSEDGSQKKKKKKKKTGDLEGAA